MLPRDMAIVVAWARGTRRGPFSGTFRASARLAGLAVADGRVERLHDWAIDPEPLGPNM